LTGTGSAHSPQIQGSFIIAGPYQNHHRWQREHLLKNALYFMIDGSYYGVHTSTMRISVIVTPEEHAKIKRAAGLVPLSAWMKSLALEKVLWLAPRKKEKQ
jgi:hypothetical protein